jgi:RNA methyltransferase, TrmH family
MSVAPQHIASRDNPLLQRIRRLLRDASASRAAGQAWIEGEHLGQALRAHGIVADAAVLSESAWARPQLQALAVASARRCVIVPEALFAPLSALPSPAGIGFLLPLPPPREIDPLAASIVLDRVQDAGNVGSMLRSAAAFGVKQVLALQGTASLWSPKVLRAGMGAHFGLALHDGLAPDDLQPLRVPLLATSPYARQLLGQTTLPQPCAWVFGHEGQGIAPQVAARCAMSLRIPQPGGEESLNVAAAAAVCLYASAGQVRQQL